MSTGDGSRDREEGAGMQLARGLVVFVVGCGQPHKTYGVFLQRIQSQLNPNIALLYLLRCLPNSTYSIALAWYEARPLLDMAACYLELSTHCTGNGTACTTTAQVVRLSTLTLEECR